MPKRVTKADTLKVATPILNRYSSDLMQNKKIDCSAFVAELAAALNTTSAKGTNETIDHLYKKSKLPVLLYVMQSRSTGPRAEEKLFLAKAFGVKTYDHPDRTAKQKSFWKNFYSPSTDDTPDALISMIENGTDSVKAKLDLVLRGLALALRDLAILKAKSTKP